MLRPLNASRGYSYNYLNGYGVLLKKKINEICGLRDTKVPGFWRYLFKMLYHIVILGILFQILSWIRDTGDPTSRASMLCSCNF